VSLIGGFGVLAWSVVHAALNKLLWDTSFVTGHAWRFPSSACRSRCSSACS